MLAARCGRPPEGWTIVRCIVPDGWAARHLATGAEWMIDLEGCEQLPPELRHVYLVHGGCCEALYDGDDYIGRTPCTAPSLRELLLALDYGSGSEVRR